MRSVPSHRTVWLSVLFLLLTIAFFAHIPSTTQAHAELTRADPPIDGLLVAPPQSLDLWLTEPVATGGGSPAIEVIDQTGRRVDVTNVGVDPADPRHVRAEIGGMGPGTFTVLWTVRSDADGHTLSGSYAFRVGSGRVPGAATVQGENPQAWGVAARWLTFLGFALAAGGFFAARLHTIQALPRRAQRRRIAAIGLGAAVALLASLAEPLLQTIWPPAGTVAPSLREAVANEPTAWWWRPAAAAALLLLVAAMLMPARSWRGIGRAPLPQWLGLGLALAGTLGLSLTGHAAGRETWRTVAVASDVLHQWAVALWVGGLGQLALSYWTLRGEPGRPLIWQQWIRRFSRHALVLVAIAVVTGTINAGFILPALHELWQSDYGRVILIKVAVLVPPLLLATVNRAAVHRMTRSAGAILQGRVRLEAVAVLAVVLGGTTLALLAPPTEATTRIAALDLAAPLPYAQGGDTFVHLVIDPVQTGANTATVYLAGADRLPRPEPDLSVRLSYTSLNWDVMVPDVPATAIGGGRFQVKGAQLSVDGWWRVEVTMRRNGSALPIVPFYFLLPDPNIDGAGAVPIAEPDPAALAAYEAGRAGYTSPHQVRYQERMADGKGRMAIIDYAVTDGSNGHPPASYAYASTAALVRVGDDEWLQVNEGPWQQRDASPFIYPVDWDEEWIGATGFRVGRTENLAGEPNQIVTFSVPAGDRWAAAWYAMWVGTESGRVHRVLMVSRSHYMEANFTDFDAPIVIDPPVPPAESAVTDPNGTPP